MSCWVETQCFWYFNILLIMLFIYLKVMSEWITKVHASNVCVCWWKNMKIAKKSTKNQNFEKISKFWISSLMVWTYLHSCFETLQRWIQPHKLSQNVHDAIMIIQEDATYMQCVQLHQQRFAHTFSGVQWGTLLVYDNSYGPWWGFAYNQQRGYGDVS